MQKVSKDFSTEELIDLFNDMDSDSSVVIEYEELIRALSDEENLLSDKNLKAAFDFFDKDSNSSITWNEIAEIVFLMNEFNQNIIQEFLDEIEQKDKNLAITFEDFKRIICR